METRRSHLETSRLPRLIAVNIFVFVFLLIVIEGSASYVLLIRDVMTTVLKKIFRRSKTFEWTTWQQAYSRVSPHKG